MAFTYIDSLKLVSLLKKATKQELYKMVDQIEKEIQQREMRGL